MFDYRRMEVVTNLCVVIALGFIGPVRSYTDCVTTSAVLAAQRECFIAQDLDLTLPTIDVPWVGQQSVTYLDVVLKQKPELVCTQRDQYRRALVCVGGVFQIYGASSISPTTTMYQIVDKLCINDTNVNLPCAGSKFNDAAQCEFKRGIDFCMSGGYLTDPDTVCKVYKSQNDCQRSLYHSCGCATVRAYETIYLDIFYQAVCPQSLSSISRVQCDFKNTSIFLNKGVRTAGGMSVLTLSLLLVVVLFCYSTVS